MAYVDFAAQPALSGPVRRGGSPLPAVAPAAPALGALEWSVVALAERDGIGSLGAPGRLSVAFATVFGRRRANPALADPRLEALRRLAVFVWRGGDAPAAEIARFTAAGFARGHYDLVRASIQAARAQSGVDA